MAEDTLNYYTEPNEVVAFPDGTDLISEDHLLQTPWTLWFHASDNDDWSLESYQELVTIESVEEFWLVFQNIKSFTGGMYFLMRQGHPPMWDWSGYKQPIHLLKYLISKRQYHELWMTLCKAAIGETITEKPDEIIGIGLSPKFRNLIISLWTYSPTPPVVNPELKIDSEKTLFK